MKKQANENIDTIYNYLSCYGYFTSEELEICTIFGDNVSNYNKICRCRYGYDVDQLAEIDCIFIEELNEDQYLTRAIK